MKKVFLLFDLLLILTSLSAQVSFPFYVTNSFPGKDSVIKKYSIKKELVYRYELNSKGKIIDSALSDQINYAATGKPTEHLKLFYTKSLKVFTNSSVFFYNTDLKVSKTISYYDSTKKRVRSIEEFTYDSSGNNIFYYDFAVDTSHLRIEKNVYNSKNQLKILWTKLDTAAFYISRRYNYNDRGNLTRLEAYQSNGKPFYNYLYEYDDSLHTQSIYLDNHHGIYLMNEYKFNDFNQLMQIKWFVKNNPNYQNLFHDKVCNIEYSTNGLVISEYMLIDNKLNSMIRHFYLAY